MRGKVIALSMVTYVEVEFEGKTHLLKYDYNAVSDLEEKVGRGIGAIFTQESIGFNLVRALYWAGLKWKVPGLTIERSGSMLGKKIQEEDKTLEDLLVPVMEALEKSKLLKGKPDEEGAAPEAEENEKN